jgi:hypothetical protein
MWGQVNWICAEHFEKLLPGIVVEKSYFTQMTPRQAFELAYAVAGQERGLKASQTSKAHHLLHLLVEEFKLRNP